MAIYKKRFLSQKGKNFGEARRLNSENSRQVFEGVMQAGSRHQALAAANNRAPR